MAPAIAKGLAFLGRNWHWIAIATLLAACYHLNSRAVHWHDQTEVCQANRKADKEAYTAAALKAKNDNLTTVRNVENKWKGVVADTEEDLNAQLAASRAVAADYARRMRAAIAAAGGNADGSGVSGSPGGSGSVEGAGGNPVVPYPAGRVLIPVPEDDLRICADNTVKAKVWPVFYNGVKKAYEEATKPPE